MMSLWECSIFLRRQDLFLMYMQTVKKEHILLEIIVMGNTAL